MIIEYEGSSYEFDLADMTVKQALKIEKHLGAPLVEFEKGMLTGQLAACQAFGWLILHGGDLDVPIDGVDFKLAKLMNAFEDAARREAGAAQEAEPDPTAAAVSNGQTSAPVSSPSG